MRRFLATAALTLLPSLAFGQTCWLDDEDLVAGELECNRSYTVRADCEFVDAENYGSCGGGYEGVEHSFTFNPPAGQQVFAYFLTVDDPLMDVDLIVTQDDNCGLGVSCVASVDGSKESFSDGSGGTIDVEHGGTDFFESNGSTYFVTVDERFDQVCDFNDYDVTITLGCTEGCDPVNDVTRPLSCSTDIAGTTASASNNLDAYVCGEPFAHLPQPNPERIYSFEPQATGPVVFKLDNMTTDQDLYVLESSCDPSSCIASSTRASVNTDEVAFNAVEGQTYYIVVESFGGAGNYDLSFEDIAGGCNEDCDDGKDNDLDGKTDCDDLDDCEDDAVCECDADGDGVDADSASCGGTDCDDVDAAVFPGAPEICDGKDNNCSGAIDEGTGPTWFPDADLDGYGNQAGSVRACSQPAGYVAQADDCDDSDPNIRPGASESCNGVDDNCNGTVDESVVNQDWYLDDDGDGFGSGSAVADCKAPSSDHVAVDGDCNDSDPKIHPDADELCDDVDHDCDGTPDNDVSQREWFLDGDGDGFGGGNAVVDCSQPGPDYLTRSGDCIDTDPAIHPAATEACNGYDDNCDGLIDVGCDEPTDTDEPEPTDSGSDGFSDDVDSGQSDTVRGTCACQTGTPAPAPFSLLLLAVFARRRRASSLR